jgi:hypothetical protein
VWRRSVKRLRMKAIVASDNNTTPRENVKVRFLIALTWTRNYVESRFREVEAMDLENQGEVNELRLGEFAYCNAFVRLTSPDDILVERAGTDVKGVAVAFDLLKR